MAEPTRDQVIVSGASRLPLLHPLELRHTVVAVNAEIQPTRYDLVAGNEAIGTLLTRDWPYATAACSHGVWRLTTERRGFLSRIGVAHDPNTGHAVAAYYPRVFPGGTIALHDTDFRLKLPLRRSDWWLFDEDDRPVAIVESTWARKAYGFPDWTVRLQQAGRDPHPDMALVLLTAVWVIATTLSIEPGVAC